ncbi:hypothetical protein Dsin_023052 [Dipteronia sinensis]|uniref:Uncharacterized protein n=1 Tax=Dipteronia sinensis TaxID=43782 RepID=A0AAE0A3I9_9ROSI|nr:hypothetical protein Dsin_023052 [Dipteronia sinensis]
MFGASPLSPSPETANDGNPIIKKRHRHRLSIQSVFPGLPNTLFIRKKPPAIEIEKRSKGFRIKAKHGHLQLRGSSRSSIEEPDRNSYLYCLSNPKTLIRGGVLRIGSDPIPAVKLIPDPAYPPLKLECLSRGGYPRNRKV